MFFRSISCFICFSVAAVTATNCSDTVSFTGFYPEVTVYQLRIYSPWMDIVRFVLKFVAIFISAYLELVRDLYGWAGGMPRQPGDRPPVPAPPPGTSAASPGCSVATPSPQRPGNHSSRGWPDVAAGCPTPPSDEAAISRLRSLPREEKNWSLMEAAKKGAVEELQLLLAAGADILARDEVWDRRTALHWAAKGGHVAVVTCLVQAGAEVDATNSWRDTPLHFAAWNGRAAVVAQLVAASADPNAKDKWGRTPLHWAAIFGHAEAAAALLDAGADSGATTNDGRTPLDMARHYNRQQFIDVLTCH